MNAAYLALFSLAVFGAGYRFYGGFLSSRVFRLDDNNITPAHRFEDGIDFVPTRRPVLFGHHFTSIAGASPIVGPAIAVIWGWFPAIVWVVLGTVFIGGTHDLGALVVSLRHEGKTIGELTSEIISPRSRTLFLILIFFMLVIVIAVFALIIAILFIRYPESVFPVVTEMVLAVGMGLFLYKRQGSVLVSGIVSVLAVYLLTYLGTLFPITLGATFMGSELTGWIILILTYSFGAAVLPVWLLLQPRDFINAQGLFVGLFFMYLGLFAAGPKVVAPAFVAHPAGAPAIIPFIFIIIACGAISGFHSLVSSGTTVKQLDKETDALPVAYGSMVGEGLLALMAVIACTAGFPTSAAWESHYRSWGAAQGLGSKIAAFVAGGSGFLSACGISPSFARAIVAVIIISFAMTTIDTSTRLQRYVISELGNGFGLKSLTNRHVSGAVAVLSAFGLAVSRGAGKGGMILWPLFGTTNQLLAGLSLLIITVYLIRLGRSFFYTLIPMLFIMLVTLWGMSKNLLKFFASSDWLLLGLGAVMFLLALWMLFEAGRVYKRSRKKAYVH
ncbi:MAG: carbon starvation protein A [bacterium]